MAYARQYANPFVTRNKIITDIDYVQDGRIVVGANAGSVMVTSESDLVQLEGYAPGSIAYTAGFVDMWQLNASGTWVALGGE